MSRSLMCAMPAMVMMSLRTPPYFTPLHPLRPGRTLTAPDVDDGAISLTSPGNLNALLEQVLAGDRAAETELILALCPVMRKSVVRIFGLARMGRGSRSSSLTIDDCVQNTIVALLKNDRALLRKFDPAKGSGDLEGYVHEIARKNTLNEWRRRRSGAKELPMAPQELPHPVEVIRSYGDAFLAREMLLRIFKILQSKLPVWSLELFSLHFLDELDCSEICEIHGMSEDSFWQWASRTRKLCREIAEKLEALDKQTKTTRRP